MATGIVTDFYVPELLAEAVKLGLRGATIFPGTEAVIFNQSMPRGDVRVGETIRIPYFSTLGELQDLADGAPITETYLTSEAETATVTRSAKLVAFTDWARWGTGGGDPYQIAVDVIKKLVLRRADQALIDAACTPVLDPITTNPINVTDFYSATPTSVNYLNYDKVIDAKVKFGDEMDGVAMMVVHPVVWGDLVKQKDTQGRPLVVPNLTQGEFSTYAGIPVMTSSRLPVLTTSPASTGQPKYTTLIVKKNSMVFWMDPGVGIENFRDITRAKTLTAINVYWAAHRYLHLNGGTYPGIQILTHSGGND